MNRRSRRSRKSESGSTHQSGSERFRIGTRRQRIGVPLDEDGEARRLTTLRALVQDGLHSHKFDGRTVDNLVRVFAWNIMRITEPTPAITIRLDTPGDLHRMANGCPQLGCYIEALQIFRFSCIFPPDETFPIARVYYWETDDFTTSAVVAGQASKVGLDFKPMHGEALGKAIQAEGFEKRLSDFMADMSRRSGSFEGMFEGRTKSTFVDSGVFLSSSGCLVCRQEGGLVLATIGKHSAVMIGLTLCVEHLAEANNRESYVNYVFELLRGAQPFVCSEVTAPDLLQTVSRFLASELDATIEKMSEDTVTLRRNATGFRMRIRMTTPLNYAHVFFDPNDREIAKIDSSDHHPIAFGPDHLHPDQRGNKAVVVSSFTYGFPPADLALIRQLLLQHGG